MYFESLVAFLMIYYGSLRLTLTDVPMLDYLYENLKT